MTPDARGPVDEFVRFCNCLNHFEVQYVVVSRLARELSFHGRRHELIDGEHYVTPSPNTRHQRLVGRLFVALDIYLRAHPSAGEAFFAPLDAVFGPFDVVEPDVLFVALSSSVVPRLR